MLCEYEYVYVSHCETSTRRRAHCTLHYDTIVTAVYYTVTNRTSYRVRIEASIGSLYDVQIRNQYAYCTFEQKRGAINSKLRSCIVLYIVLLV